MVSPEQLEALDLTHWLGADQLAAERASCSQSTISRRRGEVQRLFQVRRIRNDVTLGWDLEPASPLLLMERKVHQQHRWITGGRLRLEADAWLAALVQSLPQRWMRGTLDGLGVVRPLGLLRERVIDVWLSCCRLDLPQADDPELQVIELATLPLLVVADLRHPLIGRGNLTPRDLACFPSVAVADHLYPRFARALRRLGLWSQPVPIQRYDTEKWEGLTADQATLAYGTALSLLCCQDLQPVAVDLNLSTTVAVVVHRDLAELPPLQELCRRLRARLQALLADAPELQLVA